MFDTREIVDLVVWVSRGVGLERLVTPCLTVGGNVATLHRAWQGERFAAVIGVGGMRGYKEGAELTIEGVQRGGAVCVCV